MGRVAPCTYSWTDGRRAGLAVPRADSLWRRWRDFLWKLAGMGCPEGKPYRQTLRNVLLVLAEGRLQREGNAVSVLVSRATLLR